MSTTIEREIVQMVFDSKEFTKGVQQAIRDMDELKGSFDLKNAQKGFEQLEKAGRIDFSPISGSLDAINGKLSVFGVAAAAVVTRITNAVIDGAKKLANVLVIDPIKTGLEEYETQLNSIQTILANTARDGTTLGQVNDALDELNEYADLTIYNFTEMTNAIGRFTTAGIDLDTSVQAIKGISNVAALSGSNAQEAARAQYQLSQALASGMIRLQDWMSIENANMGGQVFQDALKETAAVHGIEVDKMIDKHGSFRLSLQEQWLSSEIMLETLAKFTGELSDADLEALGYTEEQIKAIQETATLALDAATKIKTVTQLMDVLKEALQSGWAVTWRTVFGDFEQAKELWGEVGEIFGDIIADSSDARNSMLDTWAAIGGRTALIDGALNVLKAIVNIMDAFKSAWADIFPPATYVDLFQITFKFYQFSQALLEGSKNLEPFKRIVRGLAAALDIVKMAASAVLAPFLAWIRAQGDSASSLLDMILNMADAVVAFREWAIETDYFDMVVETLLGRLDNFGEQVREVADAFMELEIVQKITKWFQELERQDFVNVWNRLLVVLRLVVTVVVAVVKGLQWLYQWLDQKGVFDQITNGVIFLVNSLKYLYAEFKKLKVVETVAGYFNSVDWAGIKDQFSDMAGAVTDLFDTFKSSDLIAKFTEYINTFDGRRFTQFMADAKEGFGWIGEGISGLTEKMGSLDTSTDDVGDGINEAGDNISEGMERILDSFITNAANIDYSQLFEVLNTGILAGLALAIKRIASGDFISDALDEVFGEDSDFGGAVIDSVDKLTDTLSNMNNKVKSETLKNIAISIALLAGSLALLTLVDSTKLTAATAAIALMVGALFGSAGALKLVNTADAAKAAIAITGMAIALTITAGAMKLISGIDPERIESSMLALTAGITSLVIGVKALSTGKTDAGLIKTVGTLFGLAAALHVLVGVIEKFGGLDPDILSQGIEGMSLSLGALSLSLVAITRLGGGQLIQGATAIAEIAGSMWILAEAVKLFGTLETNTLSQGLEAIGVALAGYAVWSRVIRPEGLFKAGLAMLVVTGSLYLLYEAVKKFGEIEWEDLQTGLIGLGIALGLVVIAANLMTGALPGAFAMLIMSGAIVIFSGALALLSALPMEGLLLALGAMAGVFIILGLAGLLLAPIVPVLFALGAAMLLIGAGAALFGLGLLAASTGLVALAGAGVAVGATITLIGNAIIELLPRLGIAIAEAFTNFLATMAENAPKIKESMKTIILSMIETVTELIPDMVAAILEMLVALLEEIERNLPKIIEAGTNIVIALLEGIANKLPDILAAGVDIVLKLIEGIVQKLPDIIETAKTVITTIATTLGENIQQIIDKGTEIGKAIVDAVINKINESAAAIAAAFRNIIDSAIQAVKDALGITSPSKVMYAIAGYMVLGLVYGIRDRVNEAEAATKIFADRLREGLTSALNSVVDDTDEMEFNPIVRPVMDLTEVSKGTATINRAVGTGSISATLNSVSDEIDVPIGAVVDQQRANGPITYNQYNYSPKALDRAAIWRQTKTHVATLSLKE